MRSTETRPPITARLGAWWVLVVGLLIGVAFAATDHMWRATAMISASCLLGAALRVVLPQEGAGGLVVRSKWLDVGVLTVLGITVGVLGFSLDLRPRL